jgi:hypothetical protein
MKYNLITMLFLGAFLIACKNDAKDKLTYIAVGCNIPEESIFDTVDLSSFIDTWNSGDTLAIRSLYASNGMYFTDEEIFKLKNQEPYSADVDDIKFTSHIEEFENLKIRIIGCPVSIYNKLVGFTFRCENDREGFTGVTILRYEGDRILIQVTSMNSEWTPNQTYDSVYFEPVDVTQLLTVWSSHDPDQAREYYSENAAILADEDLAKAPWRDFANPPTLDQVMATYGDWAPVTLNQPLRIGDRVILAWKWSVFPYPMGHGVRILHYNGTLVDMDIRYGIRPWETEGKPFLYP